MSTTNVESNDNQVKGPVFLDIDLSQNLVLSAGEFSTDRLDEFGVQEIGSVQNSHNIIDDNMRGFRIVPEGNKKRVEEIPQETIAQLIKLMEESNKELVMPVLQSELTLIEKATGYKPVIANKELIVDDEQER